MKQRVFAATMLACLILCCLLIFTACATQIAENIYYIDAPEGQEQNYNQQIHLTKVIYTDNFYIADIEGQLVIANNGTENTVDIPLQSISFSQVYGNIWRYDVMLSEGQLKAIYAHRNTTGTIHKTEEIECGNRKVAAEVADGYGAIDYLFADEYQYLLGE